MFIHPPPATEKLFKKLSFCQKKKKNHGCSISKAKGTFFLPPEALKGRNCALKRRRGTVYI
jgi:hypothetical protein